MLKRLSQLYDKTSKKSRKIFTSLADRINIIRGRPKAEVLLSAETESRPKVS